MRDYEVLGEFKLETLERYLVRKELRSMRLRSRVTASLLGISIGAAVTVLTTSLSGGVAVPIALASTHAEAVPVLAQGTTPTLVNLTSHAASAAVSYQGTVDVGPLVAYVRYITHIIQIVTGVLFGLALTYLGAKQAVSIDNNSGAEFKRYLSSAIWALLFVFGGTTIANIFISHIPV